MKKRRVLVVDDDRDIVSAIETILMMEDYHVFHAYNGTDSLKVAKEKKPDVILLDYMLPDMNGQQIAAQMKANKGLANIPIILFSAAREASEIAKRSSSIQAYIAKPFDLEELLETIKRVITVQKKLR